jgi:hypothetical protein
MEKSSKVFVGMDVHKESIDITLAEVGGEVRRLGAIGGDRGPRRGQKWALARGRSPSLTSSPSRVRSCFGTRLATRPNI